MKSDKSLKLLRDNAISMSFDKKSGGHDKPTHDKPAHDKPKGVKILAQVSGIPAGTTELIATLQIVDGVALNKTVTLEEADEDESVMFNKVDAKVGDAYAITINGTKVGGTITEPHKPNKIPVVLS
jgi:hypothetical protein